MQWTAASVSGRWQTSHFASHFQLCNSSSAAFVQQNKSRWLHASSIVIAGLLVSLDSQNSLCAHFPAPALHTKQWFCLSACICHMPRRYHVQKDFKPLSMGEKKSHKRPGNVAHLHFPFVRATLEFYLIRFPIPLPSRQTLRANASVKNRSRKTNLERGKCISSAPTWKGFPLKAAAIHSLRLRS